jgi:hypothetical protein
MESFATCHFVMNHNRLDKHSTRMALPTDGFTLGTYALVTT